MKIVTRIYDREGYVTDYKDAEPNIFDTTTDIINRTTDELIENYFNDDISKIEIEFEHDE